MSGHDGPPPSGDWETARASALPTRAPALARHDGKPHLSIDHLLSERFRVVRFIAHGGMGEVYEAEDLELRERVAIKTIRPEIADDERTMERFRREVQLARKVTHPNVCRTYDLFHHRSTERGPTGKQSRTTFLSMELLAGETLAERLRRVGRLSPDEAFPIVSQMAAGLSAAHEAGIVHRDFKCSNVLLVPDTAGRTGTRAVITDFGLAQTSVPSGSLSVSLTEKGSIRGTPAYMAPEQVQGGEVSAATDIYALGIVLYEMATGSLPFTADTPIATALKRLQEDPPSPRTHVPDLDPKWEATILRCLARSPANRFSTATKVVRTLSGENERHPASEANRRRAVLLAGFATTLIALVFVLSLVVGRGRHAAAPVDRSPGVADQAPRRSVAVLGFKNLAGQPQEAWISTALAEMVTTELAAGDELRTVPEETIAQMKISLALPDADTFGRQTLAKIRQNIDAGYIITGSYLAMSSQPTAPVRVDAKLQDVSAGETVAAVTETGTEGQLADLVVRAGARLRQKLGVSKVSTVDAAAVQATLPSDPVATRFYAEGLVKLRTYDNLAARDLLERAVAADPRHALSHAALAEAWSGLGYDATAKAESRKAFDLRARLPRRDRLFIEGKYYEVLHDWPKAIDAYHALFSFFPDDLEYGLRLADAEIGAGSAKDALATIGRLRGLAPPSRDDPRIDLAEAKAAGTLGDYRGEAAAAERAIAKGQSSGARLIVAMGRFRQALGSLTGDPQNAIAAFDDAIRIYTAAGDRGAEARMLSRKQSVLYTLGKVSEAQSLGREALAIGHEIGDKGGTLAATLESAWIEEEEGHLRTAVPLLEEGLRIARDINNREAQCRGLVELAMCKFGLADVASANRLFSEAVSLSRETGMRGYLAWGLSQSARALFWEGDLEGARSSYEEARSTAEKIGYKSGAAWATNGVGDVLLAKGDLIGARKCKEQALETLKAANDKDDYAQAENGLADIALHEGRLNEAEAFARAAAGDLRDLRQENDAGEATALLALALLGERKLSAAEHAIATIEPLIKKSPYVITRVNIATASGRVRAAAGKTAQAVQTLKAAISEAKKFGYVQGEFEARLALGEFELEAGRNAEGRILLADLEKDATAKGFLLISRKAAAARVRSVRMTGAS
jgi:eukaryotic-like serine/threonine-protein kinase